MYVRIQYVYMHVSLMNEWEVGGQHIAQLLWYMRMLVSQVNSV